jgi:hypothetical protein
MPEFTRHVETMFAYSDLQTTDLEAPSASTRLIRLGRRRAADGRGKRHHDVNLRFDLREHRPGTPSPTSCSRWRGLAGCSLNRPSHWANWGAQTLARWVILDAIEDKPATVAEIARRRGIARQAVQRVADVLERDGLAAYEPIPSIDERGCCGRRREVGRSCARSRLLKRNGPTRLATLSESPRSSRPRHSSTRSARRSRRTKCRATRPPFTEAPCRRPLTPLRALSVRSGSRARAVRIDVGLSLRLGTRRGHHDSVACPRRMDDGELLYGL